MSPIVINLEFYEGNYIMPGKDHVQKCGAKTATTLYLTQQWHGSGQCDIADSWLGSVESTSKLMGQGLHSIILKITANKDFLHQALGEEPLKYGEWKAYTSDKNEVKMQACRFSYFKVKECYLNFNLSFKFSLSSAMPGLPRKTKNTMVSWHNQKLLWSSSNMLQQ